MNATLNEKKIQDTQKSVLKPTPKKKSQEQLPNNFRALNLAGTTGNEPVNLQFGKGGEFNHH